MRGRGRTGGARALLAVVAPLAGAVVAALVAPNGPAMLVAFAGGLVVAGLARREPGVPR